MKKIIIALLMLITTVSFSQEEVESQDFRDVKSNKGKMYVFWGWNRANYSASDITFKGDDYNFTLQDVKAIDKPKPFGIYYFKLDEVTIPQTNFRIGYFFKENYTISIGVDHMKYVMRNNQTVKFDGELPVGSDAFTTGSEILLDEDFLLFEHTDGLNYVNVELSRFDNLDNWLKFPIKNIDINLTEGVGVGVLYPKTNTTLLGKERYDEFHVSGYGISAHVGLNITFFKHFFIQSNIKVGYINMQDVRTTASKTDSASQHFTFFENMYVFGAKFNLTK
ncbi:MAG: hypothetical protein GQ540_11470 [Lutibacter sp.]|uniref:hypothetical protein n=1 Tax=Lutibacter sp. TaxID=1925666 RepID=UPI0019F7005A|nr:hypothetical protein [Lutibacter sp.]NOR29135.1 hypothetical protein [Lutibacter sp.]